jgi:hypothetical protein
VEYCDIISSFKVLKINYITYNGGMLDVRVGITR